MIVMKFGGTSVGSPAAIHNTMRIIQAELARSPIVVVSAMAGVTDGLLSAAGRAVADGVVDCSLLREKHRTCLEEFALDPDIVDPVFVELIGVLKEMVQCRALDAALLDQLLSCGERSSARIVAACLNAAGTPSRAVDAHTIGLLTDDHHGNAELLDETWTALPEKFPVDVGIPIVTGFIGLGSNDRITTLGRGGSDFSAAIIGAALGAEEIQIWTDVSGVMSADPRVVSTARPLQRLSFEEAAELAYFGARVLHPKTIQPALVRGIPVQVRNTMAADDCGTWILPRRDDVTPGRVRAIACKKQITVINISSTRMLHACGFLATLFQAFARHGIVVDMIATSEVSVTVTVEATDEQLVELSVDLACLADVKIDRGLAIVCMVGEGLKQRSAEVAGRVFRRLSALGVQRLEMVSQGASEINLGFVIEENDADRVVQALHEEFCG